MPHYHGGGMKMNRPTIEAVSSGSPTRGPYVLIRDANGVTQYHGDCSDGVDRHGKPRPSLARKVWTRLGGSSEEFDAAASEAEGMCRPI